MWDVEIRTKGFRINSRCFQGLLSALGLDTIYNLQRKKSDLVKKKGKVLPRDDGECSEGQLQLSPEGACPAAVLCLDSIQPSLLEMGAVDCSRFALLMRSQPRSFLENSKYLLRQHRRAHTPLSATRSPGHGPRSPFRPSVPPLCPPCPRLQGSVWRAGRALGPPEQPHSPRTAGGKPAGSRDCPSLQQHFQSLFLCDSCTEGRRRMCPVAPQCHGGESTVWHSRDTSQRSKG